jgi:DnaJ family protein C protein 28
VKRVRDGVSLENWIDQQIRQAQEQGEFDNLPGKGQPLDLTPNPYALDQELAFKVLKDAGFAPEWIELDKTIRETMDRSRAALVRSWEWHEARLDELADRSDSWAGAERERVRSGWHKAVSVFKQGVDTINDEIADLNLKVPSPRFQRAKVDAVREIEILSGQVG